VEHELRRSGALLFPRLPDLPFDPYRAQLYDATELYGAADYATSVDAAVYAWSHSESAELLTGKLGMTLHDHAITDALSDATASLERRSIVGIMGGHALPREDDSYRAAAELGASLTREGRTVLTGGGPGAMEAANLGAYLSSWPGAFEDALTIMTPAPTFVPSIDAWAGAAFEVRGRWPVAEAGRSLSIRPGSTATNPPTSSLPESPSTSPMPCAKTRCCITAAAEWSTFRGKPVRCRKSSKR
jgi:hypothetical protein